MNICYLASDFDAPGCYRALFPGRQLQKRGHTVSMPPYTQHMGENGKLGIRYEVDLYPPTPMADIWVLQQRKERMWVEFGVQALRDHGVVTVAECDDNYLELPAYNPAFLGTHPYRMNTGRIRNREERRRLQKLTGIKDLASQKNGLNAAHMHKAFERVDAMTVSTPYLKEIYSRFNPNITVIRNYLDWEMWDDVTPQYEVERERVRIGYMGVFSYRQGDLEVIRPVIRPFLLSHPEVDFVASSDKIHDYLDVPKEQRITTGEVEFRKMRLADITAVMDVGLVPLAMNPLNEGKSHLKGMEYNACGIPFIASPTESYKDYWCDGENGLLASSSSEWMDALQNLVGDDGMRRRMGTAGRTKASSHSIQRRVGEWESFYLGLLGGAEDYLARMCYSHGAIQKEGELSALLRILRGRKLQTVVEVGSARGGTFWLWAKIAQPDALLVSVDLPAADFSAPEAARLDDDARDEYGDKAVVRMKEYLKSGQSAEFLRGNSQTEEMRDRLVEVLDGRMIDFLFIDADHTYHGVKADYELYSPLVADGGIIAFHDIIGRPQERACQVPRLWSEVRAKNRCVELFDERTYGFGRWAGIGVVYKEGALVAA